MSPSPSNSRLKWKKRKRESNLKTPGKNHKPYQEEDDDEDDDEEEEAAIEYEDANEEKESPPVVDHPLMEVLSDTAVRISTFPSVFKHAVNRPHSSVLGQKEVLFLENVSHGQLQVVSSVPAVDQEKMDGDSSASFICTPPPIMEGRGVLKNFGNSLPHIVPMHADWFSPNTVYRLERQVVPHFFSGKSNECTPERYMELRNKIVAKYLENPGTRSSLSDFQGPNMGFESYDLNRIVRFLDHWGIINYMAAPVQAESKGVRPILQEVPNGELHVPSVALRSIDSLIHFDKPKSRYRPEDVYSFALVNSNLGAPDLDSRIRERLSENHCYYCSKALPHSYYQSQKETDVTLCLDCYHDGKFVVGHASTDFLSVDPIMDFGDMDGDTWTDQETLLLLEALEFYNDNWNEIAEHVGTKTKSQCILHFVRLPIEDRLLQNIDFPSSSDTSKEDDHEKSYSNVNVVDSEGISVHVLDTGDRIPFTNSGNPVMALVAFLASAVGPRVAAACAHASLASLSKDDDHPQKDVDGSVQGDRLSSESLHGEEEAICSSPLSVEKVKAAARCGLSAAAMKAKLFADHEEREIQRLAATMINHKLKRLELKLKQFAEVETLLMKECEQVESSRQRMSAERGRVISTRFGAAGTTTQPAANTTNTNSLNSYNNRQPNAISPSSSGIATMSPFPNNHMPLGPPHQMFSFGPRLPLSIINPSAALPTPNSHHLTHPTLRPHSGTNANLGK